MIKQLAHVCIGAADLERTERFYVDLLGMELAFEFMRGGERIGFYLRAGGTSFIEVFAERESLKDGRASLKHFCLEVEDLDALTAKLTAQGVEVSAKKFGADNAWQAWITDPNGLRIELMQYTEGSAQFTGEEVALD
ncbi:MAG: VOC family protein [Chloroflexi bacterium]|nr:VOC family protein [Chloroflexota bacterium]